MTTHTYAEVLTRLDLEVPDNLVAELEVHITTWPTPTRQGDVGVFARSPLGAAEREGMIKVTPLGIAVVQGEAVTGSNSHILHVIDADQGVLWRTHNGQPGDVLLGILHVPEGAVAYLTHTDEHSTTGIGAGTWTLRAKREMADEIRRVAD